MPANCGLFFFFFFLHTTFKDDFSKTILSAYQNLSRCALFFFFFFFFFSFSNFLER